MRMNRFFKTMGPFVALAAIGALAGCGDGRVHFGGGEGVPLAELDLSGAPPHAVALMGPDTVAIAEGAEFTVTVDGDSTAADQLRFAIDDGTLAIMRDPGSWWNGDEAEGIATVRITMPAPRELLLAGSGRMSAERLAGTAEVAITGSGTLETPRVEADSLEVLIAGSGSYAAAGQAGRLEMSIAGSGNGNMAGLRAARAEINIAGSGHATFASDGEVEASIMGSGNVTVRGSARCTVNAMGSGSLVCEREPESAG
jgi:hypothetical protein